VQDDSKFTPASDEQTSGVNSPDFPDFEPKKLKVPLHAQAFGIQAVVEVLPFSLAQRGARVDPDISCTMTSTV